MRKLPFLAETKSGNRVVFPKNFEESFEVTCKPNKYENKKDPPQIVFDSCNSTTIETSSVVFTKKIINYESNVKIIPSNNPTVRLSSEDSERTVKSVATVKSEASSKSATSMISAIFRDSYYKVKNLVGAYIGRVEHAPDFT